MAAGVINVSSAPCFCQPLCSMALAFVPWVMHVYAWIAFSQKLKPDLRGRGWRHVFVCSAETWSYLWSRVLCQKIRSHFSILKPTSKRKCRCVCVIHFDLSTFWKTYIERDFVYMYVHMLLYTHLFISGLQILELRESSLSRSCVQFLEKFMFV